LGRLDGASFLLPNPDQFLSTYVRKRRCSPPRSRALRRLFRSCSSTIEVPTSAKATTRLILELVESHRTRVHALGRSAPSAARVFELVAREIVLTIPRAAKELELSQPTVGKAATRLQSTRDPR